MVFQSLSPNIDHKMVKSCFCLIYMHEYTIGLLIQSNYLENEFFDIYHYKSC